MQKRSLAEELAEYFDPTPSKEIDDDPFGEAPKLAPFFEEEGERSERSTSSKPSLLLRSEPQLGSKYAGVKTTRKDLEQEGYTTILDEDIPTPKSKSKKKQAISDEDSNSEEDSFGKMDEDEDEMEDDEVQMGSESTWPKTKGTLSAKDLKAIEEDAEEDENDRSERMDEEDEDESDDEKMVGFGGGKEDELEEELAKLEDEETGTIRTLKETSKTDALKAEHTKNQKVLWNMLLELRIHLQALLTVGNKLPKEESHRLFLEQNYKNKEGRTVTEAYTDASASLRSLLGNLLDVQASLTAQNPSFSLGPEHERKVLDKKRKREEKTEKGEEAEESEDDEKEGEDEEGNENGDEQEGGRTKQPKTTETSWDNIDSRNKKLGEHLDEVIQRWNRKTQLASGAMMNKNFKAINRSILVQIQQMLEDKDRLLKKTQLKRTPYHILGDVEAPPPEISDTTDTSAQPTKTDEETYDPEIYDDTDFYHSLLRDLVEAGTAGVTDPIALGRNYLQIKKLRVKQKKVRDRRASKGRKIRYEVMPPLVNFMPPIKGPEPPAMTDELFSSLFGQKKRA